MRVEIPFTGPTYKSESVFVSSQECDNFYLRPYPEVGESKWALFGTPGLELWAYDSEGEIRAQLETEDYLYRVRGDSFQKIDWEGTITTIGTVTQLGYTGMVAISTNGLDIIMTKNTYGYVYDLATEVFSQITDTDFQGGDSIGFIDGYYLIPKPNSGQVWRSDYNDGSSWGGLAFSSAGSDPDNLVSIVIDQQDVLLIGNYTTEIWRNVGTATFNFARIDSVYITQGGVSSRTVTRINNAVFWLGRDRNGDSQVFQVAGRQPVVISTPAISYQISKCDPIDSFMVSYQKDGHSFVILTFPLSDETFVYDSSTRMWHTRSSRIVGVRRRWRVNTHSMFKGDHIVGDYLNGKMYKMKTDVYDEDGDPMVATRTTSVIRNKQNRVTIDQMQVVNDSGVGLVTGAVEDVDPVALLSWSKDGGRNWSAESDMPLGKIGEYGNRSNVWQLGQGYNWVFRYRISAAVKRVILGAFAEMEEDDVF